MSKDEVTPDEDRLLQFALATIDGTIAMLKEHGVPMVGITAILHKRAASLYAKWCKDGDRAHFMHEGGEFFEAARRKLAEEAAAKAKAPS